jgi:hypothetical protein
VLHCIIAQYSILRTRRSGLCSILRVQFTVSYAAQYITYCVAYYVYCAGYCVCSSSVVYYAYCVAYYVYYVYCAGYCYSILCVVYYVYCAGYCHSILSVVYKYTVQDTIILHHSIAYYGLAAVACTCVAPSVQITPPHAAWDYTISYHSMARSLSLLYTTIAAACRRVPASRRRSR